MQSILMISGWGIGTQPLIPLQQNLIKHGYQVELINIFNIFETTALNKHLRLAEQFDVILGWSLGGQIATFLVDQLYKQTGKLKTLITLASNPRFVSGEDWNVGMEQMSFASLKESFEKDPVMTLKRFYYLVTQGSQTAKQDWQKLQNFIQLEDLLIQRYALEMWEKMNCVELLKKFSGQQLHVFFEQDGLVPHRVIDLIKLFDAQCLKLHSINGAHGYALFQPNLMSDKIINYLKQLSKSTVPI